MKAPSSRASSSHAFLLQHKRLLLRLGVLLCLAATAAIVGFESYAQLRDLQRQEERRQFSALSDKVQRYTEKSLSGSEQALSTIAETALQFCPDRSSWPQCAVPFAFFQRALTPLQNITDARSFALAVCVSPAQAADFEAFAYAFFEASGHPELGESPFGRGVYSLDPATQTRFHDVSGTTGDGERVMLLPNLQVTDVHSVNADAVMYNVYSTAERVRNVDFSMDCIERENRSVADCTALSGFITTAQDSPGVRPSTYFSLPIVVREGDAQVVVGFARDLHSWDTTLSLAVSDIVTGIDAVVTSTDDTGASQSYSFRYQRGVAVFFGEGDLHDRRYDAKGVSFAVSRHRGPVTCKLALYPTDEWFALYENDSPIVVSAVGVGLIVFTSLVFLLYDWLVRAEAEQQQLVLETKRQYVRYVSHEMRTPLNVVLLGFHMLEREMVQALEERRQRSQSLPLPRDGPQCEAKTDPSAPSVLTRAQSAHAQTQATSEWGDTAVTRVQSWLETVRDVLESAQNAVSVLNDLIDYDKIDSGVLSLEKEPVAVGELVRETVRSFAAQARVMGVDLSLQSEKDEGEEKETEKEGGEMETVDIERGKSTEQGREESIVVGDKDKLQQVLRILLENALKFTTAGGKVVVTLCVQREKTSEPQSQPQTQRHGEGEKKSELQRDGTLLISVTDTGAGLSAAQIESLFGATARFNPNELQAGQGSGLGLWIAKSVAAMHDGSLCARSPGQGQGSTFTLSLPRFRRTHNAIKKQGPLIIKEKKEERHRLNESALDKRKVVVSDAGASTSQPQQAEITTVSVSAVSAEVTREGTAPCPPASAAVLALKQRFPRVLVVDDSVLCRKMLKKTLEALDLQCWTANDGKECVEFISSCDNGEKERVDLVLLDYEMPFCTGPEAAAQLRAMGCTLPIVGVTGNVLKEDVDYFVAHGANCVVRKPVSVEKLIAAIGEL